MFKLAVIPYTLERRFTAVWHHHMLLLEVSKGQQI